MTGLRGGRQGSAPVATLNDNGYGKPLTLLEADVIRPSTAKNMKRKVTFSEHPTEQQRYVVGSCPMAYIAEDTKTGQPSRGARPSVQSLFKDILSLNEVLQCCYARH
mmetsp:Transcript_66203/g.196990  ORF Transcript_66203/g.196990 Transcript_66203/m.196990 type:complete len:107 (-) Transcript_66203:69-389(-)